LSFLQWQTQADLVLKCFINDVSALSNTGRLPPQELKLASFHELESVNKLAEILNASLIARPFFDGYTRHCWQTFISICKVKQTLTTGIHECSWSSCDKHERNTRVKYACELVYARRLVKARDSLRAAHEPSFLGGWDWNAL